MSSAADRPRDPGLAVERTALAWQRTANGFVTLAALTLGGASPRDERLDADPALGRPRSLSRLIGRAGVGAAGLSRPARWPERGWPRWRRRRSSPQRWRRRGRGMTRGGAAHAARTDWRGRGRRCAAGGIEGRESSRRGVGRAAEAVGERHNCGLSAPGSTCCRLPPRARRRPLPPSCVVLHAVGAADVGASTGPAPRSPGGAPLGGRGQRLGERAHRAQRRPSWPAAILGLGAPAIRRAHRSRGGLMIGHRGLDRGRGRPRPCALQEPHDLGGAWRGSARDRRGAAVDDPRTKSDRAGSGRGNHRSAGGRRPVPPKRAPTASSSISAAVKLSDETSTSCAAPGELRDSIPTGTLDLPAGLLPRSSALFYGRPPPRAARGPAGVRAALRGRRAVAPEAAPRSSPRPEHAPMSRSTASRCARCRAVRPRATRRPHRAGACLGSRSGRRTSRPASRAARATSVGRRRPGGRGRPARRPGARARRRRARACAAWRPGRSAVARPWSRRCLVTDVGGRATSSLRA